MWSSAVRLACFSAAMLLGACELCAQVDLVVRVEDGGRALRQTLEDASGGSRDVLRGDARFAGASSVDRLVPPARDRRRPPGFADAVFVLAYPDSITWQAARDAWAAEGGAAYVQENGRFMLDQAADEISSLR